MMCWKSVFVVIPALLFFALAKNWRRVIGLTLIGVLAVMLIFPVSSYAQFGLIGAIQSLLNLINDSIHSALNTIGAITQTIQSLHQQIVWPVSMIQQARATMASLISQSRGALDNIGRAPVQSATLLVPSALEAIMRNRQTNDFSSMTQTYYQTFGPVPAASDADETARNLIDADDAMALDTLKALKASDHSADLILQSGNEIEDEARSAAPGSAAFLTAVGAASNIQSQAMMQKMLVAMIRQEAARIAHENSLRKRSGILVGKARESVSDLIRRR